MDIPRVQSNTLVTSTKISAHDNVAKSNGGASSNLKSVCVSSDDSSMSEASKIQKSKADVEIAGDSKPSSFGLVPSFEMPRLPLVPPFSGLRFLSSVVIDATRSEYSNKQMTLSGQSSAVKKTNDECLTTLPSVEQIRTTATKGRKRAARGADIRFCSVEECSKRARKGGTCISHGGGSRCSVAECRKYARTGGKCISHGGGTRCSVSGCSKFVRKGGKCVFHGGCTRCSVAVSTNCNTNLSRRPKLSL